MATHRFTIAIGAPPELVFDLYTNLARMHEWTGGVTGVTDVSGPLTEAGTSYVVHFGRMRSPSRVLEVERPRRIVISFGNTVLAGESETTFEPAAAGTLMIQEFRTKGLIPGLMGRIFSIGSYKGSFRGELHEFARIAEREVSLAR